MMQNVLKYYNHISSSDYGKYGMTVALYFDRKCILEIKR